MLFLIAGLGLRGAAWLWQAVPKRFTRTEFMASVLGHYLERTLKGGAKARRGYHSSWLTSWRCE
jgi:hypothetical protein